jgi:tetratricopeptide (TPR) repeat protein
MFCKNCGTKSDGTKKFCTNCGTAFSAAAATATAAPRPAAVRPPMPKEKWTTGRIIKTVLAVVFVGGLILLKFGWGAINSIDNSAVEKNNQALDAYNSGNSEQAIAQFQQASQDAVTNTNKINSLKNLAYAYSTEGKDDLALSTFKEALALASADSVDYFLISGEIAELEVKPNAALIAYNKAYAKEPDNFQVNNSLSLFYLDLYDAHPQYSDYVKALSYAQKANQTQNDNISKKNLAIAYYFNENYTQTISLLRSVDISKEPTYAYYLGLAYANTDDTVNAKFYLRQAIAGGMTVPQEVKDYINNN